MFASFGHALCKSKQDTSHPSRGGAAEETHHGEVSPFKAILKKNVGQRQPRGYGRRKEAGDKACERLCSGEQDSLNLLIFCINVGPR